MKSISSSLSWAALLVPAFVLSAPSLAEAESRMSTEFGVLGTSFGSTPQAGIRFASATASGLGTDISLALLPGAFDYGTIAAFLDLDASVALRVTPSFTITPRAGFSGLGVGGEDLPGVAVGGNLGLGTSLRLTRAASLELQGTWRRFAGLTDGVYSFSAGIGWNLSNTAASNRDSGYPGTGRFAKPKSN